VKATAVVTAYHPDDRLAAVVESALKSCQTVIVSDNTPPGSSSAAAELTDQRVTVLTNGSNRGLGGALNAAMAVLPEDTDTVLFLDQDSVLPPELVPSLAARLDADGRIGVVAPTPWDAEHGGSYEKAAATGPALADREAHPLRIDPGTAVAQKLGKCLPALLTVFHHAGPPAALPRSLQKSLHDGNGS